MKTICTLKTMLARGLEHNSDGMAIVEGERHYTFREFADRTFRIGNALLELGLARGERVAVLSRNSAESAELYFAIPNAGLVAVMLNFRLSLPEIVAVLNDSEASVLIASDEFAEHLEDIGRHCKLVKHRISFGSQGNLAEGVITYESLIAGAAPHPPEVEVTEDDLAALVYTSGTTGIPKGCMASHRNLYHAGRSLALELRMGPDEPGIIPVPLFHVSGIDVLMNGVYSGNTSIIMPRWNVYEFIRLVQRYRVTTGLIVTPMLETFVNCQDCLPDRLVSLQKVIFAGAPVSAVVFSKAVERFGNIFIHGFGTTETLGSVAILRTEQVARALASGRTEILGSCGTSYADMRAEVVDDKGLRVAAGAIGEIRARGLGLNHG